MENGIGGSVLMVEDSEATVNYNNRLLKKKNFSDHIEIACNGEEAINYILKVTDDLFPKLILLDLNMPLLGGFGFLTKYEKLISEDRRKATLVVLLSTSILEQDMEKSKEFNDIPLFMTKPLNSEKLNDIVENYNLKYNID